MKLRIEINEKGWEIPFRMTFIRRDDLVAYRFTPAQNS